MANKQAGKLKKQAWQKKGAGKAPTFIGLPLEEAHYLQELLENGRAPSLVGSKEVSATLWTQGSFTIARLEVYADMRKAPAECVGVAKCNRYDDKLDEARGRRIALARAARGEAVIVQ